MWKGVQAMKRELRKQFEASFTMLKQCIEQYDETIWLDDGPYENPAWQIAYHAIFFANLYISPDEASVVQWEHQIENVQMLGVLPWPPHKKIIPERSYSKAELLDYLELVEKQLEGQLDKMDLTADCWPFWYNLSQFELQLTNLRHIQHHIGQLVERHNTTSRINVQWQTFE
jgi:hypothetical protein